MAQPNREVVSSKLSATLSLFSNHETQNVSYCTFAETQNKQQEDRFSTCSSDTVSHKMTHAATNTNNKDSRLIPYSSSSDESSESVLVRQNACDTAFSPAKEITSRLISSSSVSSTDLSSGYPFVGEHEVLARNDTSNQPDKNLLQPSLSVELNQPPLVGFISPSPSNESYALASDYDTRTFTIGELYDTERSYVESLKILVTKYLLPLKSSDYSGLVESSVVDEIFYQIPTILGHHEHFLQELSKKLEVLDSKQCVGDVFLETLVKPPIIETYTSFINHWKYAKEAVKSACVARNAFSKFLEATAREHKGKLALDSLLIMPVQRIPRYELLIKRLLKHTPHDHPDYSLLLEAQKEVHGLASKINCVERETYSVEQQQATLREIEILVDGLGPGNLAAPERTFLRHDYITIPSALGTRRERGIFLFSDLLVIASVKRRSTAIRKTSVYTSSGLMSALEANKFKLQMRISLNDLDITKAKDDVVKRSSKELDNLEDDISILNKIAELVGTLHSSHPALDETVKEYQLSVQRQLHEKQALIEAHMATVDLTVSTHDGTETLSLTFGTPEKRASWEEAFTEAKLRLRVMSPDRRYPPEFRSPLAIRKTRAGLQFTCAAATSTRNAQHYHDVWVCNSDGYVGQVCILSLHPEPNVASCNGVCNARITCIAAVPANSSSVPYKRDEQAQPLFPSCKAVQDVRLNTVQNDKADHGVPDEFELESESSSESSDDYEDTVEPIDFDQSGVNSIHTNTSTFQNACTAHKSLKLPGDSHGSSKSELSEESVDISSQTTMWLGTEDGCIHIYHCTENIRLKKNRTRIQQGAAVLNIVYMENRVFASLANGDVTVFSRELGGPWNTKDIKVVSLGSIVSPISRMVPVNGFLWCSSQNLIKILNVSSLSVEDQFTVSSDSQKSVSSMVSNGLGVWIAIQGSSSVRLFHGVTHECICDVSLAPAVNKILSSCDDIIRQHKAACLRVTSMLVCRDLLWVGTSAGVILTIPVPHITSNSTCRLSSPPNVTGLSHGHTGHVRFLACVEAAPEGIFSPSGGSCRPSNHAGVTHQEKDLTADIVFQSSAMAHSNRMLVISGGDGYEDFRHTGYSDGMGREDSTNHLLLWTA